MQGKFGLIGKDIGYSFSPSFFKEKFSALGLEENYSYHLLDVPSEVEIKKILKDEEYLGFNVTKPYKQVVINFLDECSYEANQIGAVNTIVRQKNGKLKGYNTDGFGFEQSFLPLFSVKPQFVIVLGNGGAAKAVQFVLKKHHIQFQVVNRNSEFDFSKLNKELVSAADAVIQCTPLGTYPNTNECIPFPFDALHQNHLVYDLIYNPLETKFLKEARLKGAKIKNGLEMLHLQAEKSWELWQEAIG